MPTTTVEDQAQAIAQARIHKAVRIAREFRHAARYMTDVSPLALARAASPADRRSVEAFAGVWDASDATWELVVLLLEEGNS